MPATIAQAINDKIKVDDPVGARLLLDGVDATLSAEARAEWRQKVAWAYYINNQDGEAFALASSSVMAAPRCRAHGWPRSVGRRAFRPGASTIA
jgi:hypothetical protein